MISIARLIVGALLAVLAMAAAAQTWPQRPVKFIVSLGPGAGADIGARLFADRLTQRWGHPVVVENRAGGDGVVAINAVLAAKDDHVLLWGPTSNFVGHPHTLDKLPYDKNDMLSPSSTRFNESESRRRSASIRSRNSWRSRRRSRASSTSRVSRQ